MFKNIKKISENMFEKVIDKSLSREGLTSIVLSAVVGISSTAFSLVNVHGNAKDAVKLAMGNPDIAQQIYDKTNKNGSVDYAINYLASVGVNLAGDVSSYGEKTNDETVSSYYISYFSKEYKENLEVKFEKYDKINAKKVADDIYKNTLNIYGKNSPDMAFVAMNEIGENKIKQTFLEDLQRPDNPLKLKIFNDLLSENKKSNILEFDEFKKKITSTKDEKEILNMYSDYIAKASKKADSEVSNYYNPNDNIKNIER